MLTGVSSAFQLVWSGLQGATGQVIEDWLRLLGVYGASYDSIFHEMCILTDLLVVLQYIK